VFVLLVGCSKEKLSKINPSSNIIAFGDSLTFGYGAPENKSYPEILKKIIHINVINEGVNGNTTKDGVDRITDVIDEYNPSLIIIGLGGNDMLRKVSESEIRTNLIKMINISKSKKIQVVLLAIPKPSTLALVGYLNDAEFYKEIAKENKVILIDGVYSTWLSKKEYKSDMIHLNEMGYEKVAEQIAEELKNLGAIN